MKSSKSKLAGWILSGLLALFLVGPSAMGKFVDWEGKDLMFEKLGLTNELVQKIGVLEIVLAVLFIIPRTGFLGAILLTGYFGGAILTHLRIGDSIVFVVCFAVLLWICLGLRQPEIFALALGKSPKPPSPPDSKLEHA